MGKVIINQGKTNTLVITIPAKGDVDWASQIRQAFQDICDHDHTGGIKGTKITGDALANNTIKLSNIDLEDITLNSFLNIQDAAVIPSGAVLLWSNENQTWYPSSIENSNLSNNVYVITNDTDLSNYDPTPGDILYINDLDIPDAFTNGVVGAADFSFYNKDLVGVKIISKEPLVMAEMDRCTILADADVTLLQPVTTSDIRSVNDIYVGTTVSKTTLKGEYLRDTGLSSIAFDRVSGVFFKANLVSNNITMSSTCNIHCTNGATSLSYLNTGFTSSTDPIILNNPSSISYILRQGPWGDGLGYVTRWIGASWSIVREYFQGGSTTNNKTGIIYSEANQRWIPNTLSIHGKFLANNNASVISAVIDNSGGSAGISFSSQQNTHSAVIVMQPGEMFTMRDFTFFTSLCWGAGMITFLIYTNKERTSYKRIRIYLGSLLSTNTVGGTPSEILAHVNAPLYTMSGTSELTLDYTLNRLLNGASYSGYDYSANEDTSFGQLTLDTSDYVSSRPTSKIFLRDGESWSITPINEDNTSANLGGISIANYTHQAVSKFFPYGGDVIVSVGSNKSNGISPPELASLNVNYDIWEIFPHYRHE